MQYPQHQMFSPARQQAFGQVRQQASGALLHQPAGKVSDLTITPHHTVLSIDPHFCLFENLSSSAFMSDPLLSTLNHTAVLNTDADSFFDLVSPQHHNDATPAELSFWAHYNIDVTPQHSFSIQKSAKPFKCSICHYSFKRNHDLQRHIRQHTGLKPYSCKLCGKAFARSDYVKRHACARRNRKLH
jgi:hypothetical protein